MSRPMWHAGVMTPIGSLPRPSRIPPILPPLRHGTATHLLALPILPVRCVGSFRNSADSDWEVSDSVDLPSTSVDPGARFLIHEGSGGTKLREALDDGVSAKKAIELVGVDANAASGGEVRPAAAENAPDALAFVFWSILLVVAFWLGNYVAPELIFRNTVFRRESIDKPDATESKKEEL